MWLRVSAWTVAALVCGASVGQAQTVLKRARLGNNIEDITYVSRGRLAHSLVLANGYEIFVAPLGDDGGGGEADRRDDGGSDDDGSERRAGAPAASRQFKLFDVRTTPIDNGPRGIAFIPTERLIAFHSADDPTLYLIDEDGAFRGTRRMTFPGSVPTYLEGMDFVPQSAPLYPSHLIVAANLFADPTLTPRIEVARQDGVVDAEIVVRPYPSGCVTLVAFSGTPNCAFDPNNGILGLAYQAPGRMLVSLNDGRDSIWAIDFTGNVIGTGPVYSGGGTHAFEGIVQLPNGRVYASNYETGQLICLDRELERVPAEDRVYSVGIGLSAPAGLAWDSTHGRHLTLSRLGLPSVMLGSVAPALDAATNTALDVSGIPGLPQRMTFVPDANGRGRVVTVSRRRPNPQRQFAGDASFTFFDPSAGGSPTFQFSVSNANLGGAAQSVEFVPINGGELAVGVLAPWGKTCRFVSLTTHAIVGGIPLPADAGAPRQLAFDPSDPSGGRFLITDDATAFVVDMNGTEDASKRFDIRTGLNLLVPRDLSFISTGRNAGSFAIVDPDNSELVVFKLPGN